MISAPTYLMAKPIGGTCNLGCEYCYYALSGAHRSSHATRMSDQILETYVREYIAIQPEGAEVVFCWHGGEPLLRERAFFERAVALQQRYADGHTIVNTIQTNGTLLTEDTCRWLHDQDFLVGISIDGPRELHDCYRKTKAGAGSFDQVMRAIEMLHRHQVEYNIMAVIHRQNVQHPLETYRFLRSLGTPFLQFTPNVEYVNGQLTPSSVDPVDFGKFYCTIFDEWFQNDVGRVFVQLFDATLSLLMDQPSGVCLYGERCAHAAVLEADGGVYACDHFATDEWLLGNIQDTPLDQLLFNDRMAQFGLKKTILPKSCMACSYRKVCNGECPKNNQYLCAGYQLYFAHTLPVFEHMQREILQG